MANSMTAFARAFSTNPLPPPDPRVPLCDSALRGQGAGGGPYSTGCDLIHSAAVIESGKPLPGSGGPEFPDQDVIYVNGISTSEGQELMDIGAVASILHQKVTGIHLAANGSAAQDLTEVCAPEKLGATHSPVENAVHDRIKEDLDKGKRVHVLSHSAGALVTQRALERIAEEYKHGGMSESDVRKRMSNVEFESFGGAAGSVPEGVKAVAYADVLDPVANEVGAGTPNPALDIGLMSGGIAQPLTQILDSGRQAGAIGSPFDGRVIPIAATGDGKHALNSTDTIEYAATHGWAGLLGNHDVHWYLQNRQNFAEAYAPSRSESAAQQKLIDSVNLRTPAPPKIPRPVVTPNPQP